jgi:hypothetical protein
MTVREIEDKFDRMQLVYIGPINTIGLRAHRGYWAIPEEPYEFRLIAVEPRNTWAIEVRDIKGFVPVSLLSAEMGITFIQNIICDKFEFIGSIERYNWFKHQEQKASVIMKRIEFLMWYNTNKKNGKNSTTT